MSRTVNVIRLQLVNKDTYLWIPALVLAGSLVVSIAIYAIIHSAGVDTAMYGGGSQAPLWYFGIVGMQALTLTFPFSQAMSVTRREFYLGTLATAAITAVGLAVIFVIGGYVELATDGWGLQGYFFHLPWIWESGPVAAGVVYFAVAMLFFVLGFWGATIFKRYGTLVVTVVLLAVAAVLVALIWLVTANGAWPDLIGAFVDLGALGLALWGLLGIAILAASSYLTLRRAIP